MNFKDIIQKVKEFINDKKLKFKELKKEKKIAIIIGVVAIVLATVFGIKYLNDSKYEILFSGLATNDASAITEELESKNIDMKIEGDSIYVPKEQVDKLRLELSDSITNGSKGFELMDEGSSFGLTDEEFMIKKQRMIQGEIEKTIKTFPQVEDARVHITQGTESVFANESTPGSAAVSLTLKRGATLQASQIRSIMSLVSASSTNIPKQNVEIVDQNMNLLSDGLFDEDGKVISSNSSGIDIARKAEKDLSSDLEKSIVGLLEPIFGPGKVKATVNADLNFDSSETTEITIDPNSVIISESRSENTSTESSSTGGTVDNNMNNTADDSANITGSKTEDIQYETGRVETKTTKAQGEINKITASVAIDGKLTASQIRDVNDMVANTIGMDTERGDNVKVVSMDFGIDYGSTAEEGGMSNTMKIMTYVGIGLLLIAITGLIIFFVPKKKKEKEVEEEIDEEFEIDLINQKLEEIEKSALIDNQEEEESITLEEEVRNYAAENPDKVTDLINSWLNG